MLFDLLIYGPGGNSFFLNGFDSPANYTYYCDENQCEDLSFADLCISSNLGNSFFAVLLKQHSRLVRSSSV